MNALKVRVCWRIINRWLSTNSAKFSDAPTEDSTSADPLYPGHIATSVAQKAVLSVGTGTLALFAPNRDDLIATFGEVSGDCALRYMHRKMRLNETGRRILEERPQINTSTVDLAALNRLPHDTLGHHYVTWLEKNYHHHHHHQHADPDRRRPVQFVDSIDRAYVMQRYRQIHDLTHVTLGVGTNWIGEVSVKIFEGVQYGLPMCVLGAAFGPLRFVKYPKHRRQFLDTYLWWALRNAWTADFLLNVYFEKHWEMPIDDFRHMLSITPPPKTL